MTQHNEEQRPRAVLCRLLPGLLFGLLAVLAGACDDEPAQSGGVGYFEGEPQPVDPTCTSVRLTSYDAGDGGWCEFSSSQAVLPDFVRDGMHLAIAEPWNGGSFQGASGEACGECWEVSTVSATAIVMVNNLCPIEGNPLCSGGHFHFDLSQQAAAVLGGGGLDEASARRVPCPVEGNIHAQVNDSNEWGYLRFAVINHRIPVRAVEVGASPDGPFVAAERSGGAMHVLEGPTPDQGDGIWFRLTSAMGETVTATLPVPYMSSGGSAWDLGVQFAQLYNEDEDCDYAPPADVYDDDWGGIEGVTWQPNPWGDGASVREIDSGCADDSASCLRVTLGPWAGSHFYYRQSFPVATFSGLSVRMKGIDAGEITVFASGDDGSCEGQTASLSDGGWVTFDIPLATACAGISSLHTVTVTNGSDRSEFLMDDILFD